MAIIALVMAVAGLLVPVVLAVTALAMAVISTRRIRRSGGALTGRGLAQTAGVVAGVVLLVNALTIVGLVNAWPEISQGFEEAGDAFGTVQGIAEGRLVDWYALREGDCYLEADPENYSFLERVGCGTPHDGEVYAVVSLGAGAFPGDESVNDSAASQCGERYLAYVGESADHDALEQHHVVPDEFDWDTGVKSAICVLASADGERLVGSRRAGG